MKGQDYIDSSRKYLDYLEEHLNNVARAFQEVSEACEGMAWVGDDYTWHTLKREVEYHDVSKFTKEEFTQYRDKFFTVEPQHDYSEIDMNFNRAWENHKRQNNHHWETIRYIEGKPGLTENDVVHMVVDWTAMGYKFCDTAKQYYENNGLTIKLSYKTVEFMYEIFDRLEKYNKEG